MLHLLRNAELFDPVACGRLHLRDRAALVRGTLEGALA